MPELEPTQHGLTPEPPPVVKPTTPVYTPPTVEQLAQQVDALQAQLQSLNSSYSASERTIGDTSQLAAQLQTQFQTMNSALSALNQAFSVLEIQYKLHTHVVAPGQTTIQGNQGLLYTVPVTNVDNVLDALGSGGPPPYNPISSGPPVA